MFDVLFKILPLSFLYSAGPDWKQHNPTYFPDTHILLFRRRGIRFAFLCCVFGPRQSFCGLDQCPVPVTPPVLPQIYNASRNRIPNQAQPSPEAAETGAAAGAILRQNVNRPCCGGVSHIHGKTFIVIFVTHHTYPLGVSFYWRFYYKMKPPEMQWFQQRRLRPPQKSSFDFSKGAQIRPQETKLI